MVRNVPTAVPAASGEFFTEEQSKRVEESRDYEIKFAIFEALQGLFGGDDTGSESSEETACDSTDNDFAKISVFGILNCDVL